jgi:hypothetical protein
MICLIKGLSDFIDGQKSCYVLEKYKGVTPQLKRDRHPQVKRGRLNEDDSSTKLATKLSFFLPMALLL